MAKVPVLELSNGVRMPIIGLGTWQAKDEELRQALETALNLGYRHFDTAAAYSNERILGEVLSQWIRNGKIKREDVFITTKLPSIGTHPERVEMFMKRSLEQFQMEYVDLYLIHFPVGCKYRGEHVFKPKNDSGEAELEGVTDLVEIWRKMEDQVRLGRTKAIGLSNFNTVQIDTILKNALVKPVNLQIEVHLYFQQRQLVNYCKEKGISVVAYAPLGSPDYNKFLKSQGKEEKKLPNILNNEAVTRIAQIHSKTAAQVALRHIIQRGMGAVPKSTVEEQLKDNIAIFDFNLDEQDMKELDALDQSPDGRIFTFGSFPGIEKHPDFPFK